MGIKRPSQRCCGGKSWTVLCSYLSSFEYLREHSHSSFRRLKTWQQLIDAELLHELHHRPVNPTLPLYLISWISRPPEEKQISFCKPWRNARCWWSRFWGIYETAVCFIAVKLGFYCCRAVAVQVCSRETTHDLKRL